MEPRVQYARTEDGVSIAYATKGSGFPLVLALQPGIFNAQTIWDFDRLAGRFRVVAFDFRGMGLSDRRAHRFELDAVIRDLKAVVDAVGIDRFALSASHDGAPIAIRYTASHPDRVTHLVILDGWADRADFEQTAAHRMQVAIVEGQDWTLYTETLMSVLSGLPTERVAGLAEQLRANVEPDTWRALMTAELEWDVRSDLAAVRCPTLVLQSRSDKFRTREAGQRIAASIPGAQFAWMDDLTDETLPAMFEEFILQEAPDVPRASSSGVRTVLFTDLVGHTEMMQRLGDAKGRDVLREHERITRDCLREHGGSEVKTMGDGFMASFGSVTAAMECAIALQRAFAARTDSGAQPAAPAVEPLQVRVGLNAGEPIEEDGDLFGATVILAARIAARAAGGEILIPEPVRHLLAGKPFVYADRGEFVPKGFDDAVRVFDVRWRE